jgi:hypothetical protein
VLDITRFPEPEEATATKNWLLIGPPNVTEVQSRLEGGVRDVHERPSALVIRAPASPTATNTCDADGPPKVTDLQSLSEEGVRMAQDAVPLALVITRLS